MPETLLITGANGFIGKNAVEYFLKNTGWNLILFDKAWDNKTSNSRITYAICDLNNLPLSSPVLPEKIEYVIHLAAEKDVSKSFSNIEPYIINNVLGSARLFNWLRSKQCKKIINFSTAAVIGPRLSRWARSVYNMKLIGDENSPMNPFNPYAGSKAAQECVAISYANTYDLPIVNVRIDVPFGEGQPMTNFLPRIIKSIVDKKIINLFGKTLEHGFFYTKRNWIYIKDVCMNLKMVLSDKSTKSPIHFIGNDYDMKEMLDKIAKLIGNKKPKHNKLEINEKDITQDVNLSYGLSSEKIGINNFTNYAFDLKLLKTIKWYKRKF